MLIFVYSSQIGNLYQNLLEVYWEAVDEVQEIIFRAILMIALYRKIVGYCQLKITSIKSVTRLRSVRLDKFWNGFVVMQKLGTATGPEKLMSPLKV